MNLKNKQIYYIIGLVVAFITLIPTLPKLLCYVLAMLPILFFGADLTMQYMQLFYKKVFINRHMTAILVALGLIVTGKLPYAAITMIFFSAADFYFERFSKKAMDRMQRLFPTARRYVCQAHR